jgi:hypothetical protein
VPDATAIRRLLPLTAVFLLIRIASAVFVSQPGYTDAYYYVNVAARLARGLGLTADFVWSPVELGPLPIVSHTFWMPLATVLQALGIVALGPLVGDFRAAQAAIILVAALVPAATYICARSLGASDRAAIVAAVIAGLGGLFAPGWVTLDGFAPAALIGALFFLAYARAADGDVRAGAAAGALVGLLYLTRAEGALFGLALLALAARPASRTSGLVASGIALAIGGAWLAREVSVGVAPDMLARTALLVRYEQFFAVASPTLDAYLRAMPDVLVAKASALATNAFTFLFAFAIVLIVPLARGVRDLWPRPDVRAWALLAALIFLAQSLVWTLHSTRGSYFHSLGAFYPFGIALAAAGGERLLAARTPEIARAWTWGSILVVAALSIGAITQWDATFTTAARIRAAALDAVPAGSFLAIDAGAWRWLSGRSVIVTPADGVERPGVGQCALTVTDPHATSIVLEEAHFSAYDSLYRDGPRPEWLGPPIVRGTIKIFPIISGTDTACAYKRP